MSSLLGESWSFDKVRDKLPTTTPTAMLISILIVSLYIFYKMFRIMIGKPAKVRYSGAKNSDGQYHGDGELVNGNGDTYRGQFVNGQFDGHGVYTFANTGCKYEGNFASGKFHGRGRESYEGGHVYIGEFKHGLRDGKGKMEYGNGGVYDGQWKEGKKHGRGRVKDQNSERWRDGQWKMGRPLVAKDQASSPSQSQSMDE